MRKNTSPIILEARPAVQQEHTGSSLPPPHIVQLQPTCIRGRCVPPGCILHRNIKHLISVHLYLLYQYVKSESNLIKWKCQTHDQNSMLRTSEHALHFFTLA